MAAYLLVGIPQLFAVASGLVAAFSLPNLDAALLGALIAYLPIIGTFGAVAGAQLAWGWPWPIGLVIFIWTIPLSLGLIFLSIQTLEWGRTLRRMRSSAGPRHDVTHAPRGNERDLQRPQVNNGTEPVSALASGAVGEAGLPIRENGYSSTAATEIPSGPRLLEAATQDGRIGDPEWLDDSSKEDGEASVDRLDHCVQELVLQLQECKPDPVEAMQPEANRAAARRVVESAREEPERAFALAVGYLLRGNTDVSGTVASHLFEGAAEAGLSAAQFNLAVMRERGEGLRKDPDIAREWYQRAAEQGHPRAIKRLAEALRTGDLGSPSRS